MVVAWCSTTLSGTALFEGGSGQDPSPETAAAGRFEDVNGANQRTERQQTEKLTKGYRLKLV